MHETLQPTLITGRFTVEELEHLAGTIIWPRSVPETVDMRDRAELARLVELARDYIEKTHNAFAVDLVDSQIVNVVTR